MGSEPAFLNSEGQENSVELVEAAGEWFVRTLEAGREQVTSFQRKERAVSYAERRASKLGVQVVSR